MIGVHKGTRSRGKSRLERLGGRSVVKPALVIALAAVTLLANLGGLWLVRVRESGDPLPAGNPGTVSEGLLGNYILLYAFGLAVAASLALISIAVLALFSSGSEPVETGTGSPLAFPEASRPDPTDELRNAPWMSLVEGCVDVVDELDRHATSFDAPRRELAEHVTIRLEEALGRSGVEIIAGESAFDRMRHKPVAGGHGSVPGAPVFETLSPGFAVGRRVLRRARVRLG